MQVQVRTDNNINGNANMIAGIESDLTDALRRFGNQITRVEVYFHDDNGPKKTGDDKSCTLEARLAGRQPIAVTHEAGNLRQSIDGALHKLERMLDRQLGKLAQRKGRLPYSEPETN
jgi:ribosome-associated translation inhibitor RaiA